MADRVFFAGSDSIISMLCDVLKKARSYQPYILLVGAFASFLMLIVALFTDHWLNLQAVWAIKPHSGELLGSKTMENTTEVVQREKRSFSGLWRLCCGDVDCSGICRTLAMSQNSDATAATSSLYVIGILRKTNIFPVVSVMLAFSGAVFVGAGMIWIAKKHVFSLAGGVNLVVSAPFICLLANITLSILDIALRTRDYFNKNLCTAGALLICLPVLVHMGLTNVLGIIIFISSNDKLSKRSSSGTEYGWSFYCAGLAFVLTEILGVVIIQELVKDVERSNEDSNEKSESGSNIEEGVSRCDSFNNRRKSVSMPPSMNLRRSVRKKSRASLSISGNDLNIRGNLLSRENSAEIACAAEPVMGLPCSDSGYNGASSFNLKLPDCAKHDNHLQIYASSDSDHDDIDDYDDNHGIDLNQLKSSNMSRGASKSTQRSAGIDVKGVRKLRSKIPPIISCKSIHSPTLDYQGSVFSTNHTQSTISFPPPLEFQNEKRSSARGAVDSAQSEALTMASISSKRGQTKPYANGVHKKRFVRPETINVMSKEQKHQKDPINYQFFRKHHQYEQSSFDSNQTLPADQAYESGKLRDKKVPESKVHERRTPTVSTKSPLSISSARCLRGRKTQESHTSINDSPIVKAFRSQIFSKQNWIKSRGLERGQSRDSDEMELRSIDQITDSGYRSAGHSTEAITVNSLPRISRSRSTLPDGRIQVTRYENETHKPRTLPGMAAIQNLPSSPLHRNVRIPTFMSSNSSFIRAIRRSSSTSFLQETGSEQNVANNRFAELGTSGSNIWPGTGPITAL